MQDKRSFFGESLLYFRNCNSAIPPIPVSKAVLRKRNWNVRFYTVTDAERACCDGATRASTTRLGFTLLLKSYQRLGYFVTSGQVPNAIVEHIAASIGESRDRDNLRQYDVSQARRKHLSAVRHFLAVKPFGDDGKALMRQTFAEAALTKEDVIDIVNIGIETLVRHRYELPAF